MADTLSVAKILDESRELCSRESFEAAVGGSETSIQHAIGVVGPRRQGKSTFCNRLFFKSDSAPFKAERGFRGVTRGIDAALNPETGTLVLDSEGLFDINRSDDCVLAILFLTCSTVIFNTTSNLDDSHLDAIAKALRLYSSGAQHLQRAASGAAASSSAAATPLPNKTLIIYLQGSAQGDYPDAEFAHHFPIQGAAECGVTVLYRCVAGRSESDLPHDLLSFAASNASHAQTASSFYSLLDTLRPLIKNFDSSGTVNWDAVLALQYPCGSTCKNCTAHCQGSSVLAHDDHKFTHEEIACKRRCRACLGFCLVKTCHTPYGLTPECVFVHNNRGRSCADMPIPWYVMSRCPFCRYWTDGTACECPSSKVSQSMSLYSRKEEPSL